MVRGAGFAGLAVLAAVACSRHKTMAPARTVDIVITIAQDGAAPEAIEREVVNRVEDALVAVPRLVTVRSESRAGAGVVTVSFPAGSDAFAVATAVRAAVEPVLRQLPQGADFPVITRAPGDVVLRYLLSGPYARPALHDLDRAVRDVVQATPGVAAADGCGGGERELRIDVASDKLDAVGIDVNAVIDALAAGTQAVPAGQLIGAGQLSVRVVGSPVDREALGQLAVITRGGATIRLRDVAMLEDGTAEPRCSAHFRGMPVLATDVRVQAGADPGVVRRELERRLAERARELPKGATLTVLPDQHAFAVTVGLPPGVGPAGVDRLAMRAGEALPDDALIRWRAEWPDQLDVLVVPVAHADPQPGSHTDPGGAAPEIPATDLDKSRAQALTALARMLEGPGVVLRTPARELDVRVSGPDLEELARLAELLRAAAGEGFAASGVDGQRRVPTVTVALDRARLAELGISPATAARALEAAQEGARVGELRASGEAIPIVVRIMPDHAPTGAQPDPAELARRLATLRVAGAKGLVPLSAVASIRETVEPGVILHVDRMRSMVVWLRPADAAGDLGDLGTQLRRRIAVVPLPAGYLATVR